MVERAKAAGFNTLALTVDTITGGNRERDLYTGFTSPPRLTLNSLLSFATHPGWAMNYFLREPFELAELKDFIQKGSNVAVSIGDYFAEMLDPTMNWSDAEALRAQWGGPFCLKGIMSVAAGAKKGHPCHTHCAAHVSQPSRFIPHGKPGLYTGRLHG
jgi:L-lactate dehydrogenase (cytochrome)